MVIKDPLLTQNVARKGLKDLLKKRDCDNTVPKIDPLKLLLLVVDIFSFIWTSETSLLTILTMMEDQETFWASLAHMKPTII